jgi:hypothetical protein
LRASKQLVQVSSYVTNVDCFEYGYRRFFAPNFFGDKSMKNRKKLVKAKLDKIRKTNQEKARYEKQIFLLKRESEKLSNKQNRLFTPDHLPGNFVRVISDIREETVVRYSYHQEIRFARILKNDLMLVLHSSEVSSFIDAKFKNGRMRPSKSLDKSETEVIMV